MIERLLRDPLIHFLLAGAALFAVYAAVAGDTGERRDRIVVSEARVASLASAFARTWMRPPTEAELRGLVDDYVIEEIFYREALALGLDRDDLIVRRRMRQKMEFLGEAVAEREPTEAELAAFLAAHPERFALPALTSFVQVFLDSDSEPVDARAAALLARLRADGVGDVAALGDPTLLPPGLERATREEIASQFGSEFAEAIAPLPEGGWSGPIASSLGRHLVRIDAREPARGATLDEVHDAVRRELMAAQRDEARARAHAALRERYEIVLPDAFAAPAAADARE